MSTETLADIISEVERLRDLRRSLKDIAARLHKLKGVPSVQLGKGGPGGIMFADGVCGSPIPRFGAECIPLADTLISVGDVANALDRVADNLGQVSDPLVFLDDLISLLGAFDNPPVPSQ